MKLDTDENAGRLWRSPFLILALVAVTGFALWFAFGRQAKLADEQSVDAGSTSIAAVEQKALSGLFGKSKGIVADYPGFNIVRVTRSGTGVITGSAAPNTQIEILVDDQPLGRTAVDSDGQWLLIFSQPLKEGGVELSLKSILPDGKEIVSPSIVVVAVPGAPNGHFIEGEGESVVAIMCPRDRVGKTRIMQRPGPELAAESIGAEGLALETLDYDDAGKASLYGRAPGFSEVRIYLNNKLAGVEAANQNGKWELALADSVAVGRNVLRVDQINEKNKVELRLEVPFERAEPLPYSKASARILVRPGVNAWQISRKISGNGFQNTLVFKTGKDQIKDPDPTYPGQSLGDSSPGTTPK